MPTIFLKIFFTTFRWYNTAHFFAILTASATTHFLARQNRLLSDSDKNFSSCSSKDDVNASNISASFIIFNTRYLYNHEHQTDIIDDIDDSNIDVNYSICLIIYSNMCISIWQYCVQSERLLTSLHFLHSAHWMTSLNVQFVIL